MAYLKLGNFLVLVLIASGQLAAQVSDPSYVPLTDAYEALKAHDYDRAIAGFEQALAAGPDRADVRKNLAYTLLKAGESASARDHFAAALALDPSDDHVALEYAFLCFETKKPVEARRTFDRLRETARLAEDRKTAAEAFENIDRPLHEGITRWQEALEIAPGNFSAHEELARLAEERDDLFLAEEHYEKAWKLRPDRRSLLLDLGRVWKAQDRLEDSRAALLAASRGGEPRVAEEARELLPARYPYVYEFERALQLDPSNIELRRELAYLRLQMGDEDAAEQQFGKVVERAPDDLLSVAQLGFLRLNRGDQEGAALLAKVAAEDKGEVGDRVRVALHMPPALKDRADAARAEGVPVDAKMLAERSLEKGYLVDALKYLRLAHEEDPQDDGVALKLGWTYNLLKDDRQAVRYFDQARRSADPSVATEAARAYRNLAPEAAWVRSTLWAFPTFSTRWNDLFLYAQIKTELGDARWLVHPYLSVRGIGDVRDKVGGGIGLGPQYLSERSAIVATGIATRPWKGLSGWFEAGEAFHYRAISGDSARILPDYRGGVSYAKGWGHLLGGNRGWFGETSDDGVFVSRFQNDFLMYTQSRTGYTLHPSEGFGSFQAQVYWNWNLTADTGRQWWANFVETGPGVRFRFRTLPVPLLFSVNTVWGTHVLDQIGVARSYNDVRIGVWYALTR